MTAASGIFYWFRLPDDQTTPGKTDAVPAEEVEDKKADEPEALILCRNCSHAIAHPKDRVERNGVHRHTFANPHGIVYEILCFRAAEGAAASGPATNEFTWFKGYRWRVAVCRACLVHLGWLFIADGGDRFYGLIEDRLIFPG